MARTRSQRRLRCLYCTEYFTRGSGEHTILSALGGRKQTRTACCQACNLRLGDAIDAPLASALKRFSNLLGITTGRGKPAPMVKTTDARTGDAIDIRSGGEPSLSKARVDVSPLADGRFGGTIVARSVEEATRLLQEQLARFGTTRDNATITAKRVTYRPDPPPFRFELGSPEHLRSVAKMALNYLCAKISPDRVRASSFKKIIDFINGTAEPADGWVGLDYTNSFPSTDTASRFDHRILVFGVPSERLVYALLELFGAFRFSVILTDEWDGPEFGYAHSVDPVEGGVSDGPCPVPGAIAKDGLLNRRFQNEQLSEPLDRFLRAAYDAKEATLRQKIIEDCLREHWDGKGALITEQMVKAASLCIATRYTEALERLDRTIEEPIDIVENTEK